MILGNKFIPPNKSIAMSATYVFDCLKQGECKVEDIIKNTDLDLLKIIDSLELLYMIGLVEYKEGKICLKK
ncbi:MAG: hypothetical protein RSE56_03225 [Bacilli bacterium]